MAPHADPMRIAMARHSNDETRAVNARQDADRTPWPTHSPAIPTIWEGVEEPLSTPMPTGGGQ